MVGKHCRLSNHFSFFIVFVRYLYDGIVTPNAVSKSVNTSSFLFLITAISSVAMSSFV